MLFLPDQHLGRNTAVRELGLSLDDCVLYDPHKPHGGVTREQLERRADDPLARALLGARPVQRRGRRRRPARDIPGVKVSSTPSAGYEVCELADEVGSTE